MAKDVTQLVMARYHINELEKQIERDSERLHEMWKELKRKCDHPTFKIDSNYSSGGYDYVSSVQVIHTCTLCNEVIKCYDDPNHHGSFA